ncbi:MAG: hypothetical protein V2A79_10085 [Planctomycetota bacterium]
MSAPNDQLQRNKLSEFVTSLKVRWYFAREWWWWRMNRGPRNERGVIVGVTPLDAVLIVGMALTFVSGPVLLVAVPIVIDLLRCL